PGPLPRDLNGRLGPPGRPITLRPLGVAPRGQGLASSTHRKPERRRGRVAPGSGRTMSMSTKRGVLQAFLGLTAAVLLVLGIQAGQPRPQPGKGDNEKFDKAQITAKQKILQERYREFEQSLLILKQRLERSDRKEDRDRAAQLAKVLELSSGSAVSTKFSAIV